MDGPWPQDAIFLFCCALPCSMLAWVGITEACGWLRDRNDEPGWYRFIADRFGVSPDSSGTVSGRSTPATLVVATGFWLFSNILPVWAFVIWPYGLFGRLVIVGYFALQAAVVYDLRRAIRRARAK